MSPKAAGGSATPRGRRAPSTARARTKSPASASTTTDATAEKKKTRTKSAESSSSETKSEEDEAPEPTTPTADPPASALHRARLWITLLIALVVAWLAAGQPPSCVPREPNLASLPALEWSPRDQSRLRGVLADILHDWDCAPQASLLSRPKSHAVSALIETASSERALFLEQILRRVLEMNDAKVVTLTQSPDLRREIDDALRHRASSTKPVVFLIREGAPEDSGYVNELVAHLDSPRIALDAESSVSSRNLGFVFIGESLRPETCASADLDDHCRRGLGWLVALMGRVPTKLKLCE